MNNQSPRERLNSIDAFAKNYAQAKAHLNCLTIDDQFKYLNCDDMSATLWAISDRLKDMERTFKQVVKN